MDFILCEFHLRKPGDVPPSMWRSRKTKTHQKSQEFYQCLWFPERKQGLWERKPHPNVWV
jgi:hypothetical protein